MTDDRRVEFRPFRCPMAMSTVTRLVGRPHAGRNDGCGSLKLRFMVAKPSSALRSRDRHLEIGNPTARNPWLNGLFARLRINARSLAPLVHVECTPDPVWHHSTDSNMRFYLDLCEERATRIELAFSAWEKKLRSGTFLTRAATRSPFSEALFA